MTEATAEPQPFRSEVDGPVPAAERLVSMQSDPPWLRWGLLGVTAASLVVSLLYMLTLEHPRPPLALSILPGLAVAAFAGAALAWWGRRHGGSLALQRDPHGLSMIDRGVLRRLVDEREAYGVVLCTDAAMKRRVMLLSQRREAFFIVDSEVATDTGTHWKPRTMSMNLGPVPLSAATANTFVVAMNRSLQPLLPTLSTDEETPWFVGRLADGTQIVLTEKTLQLGSTVLQRNTDDITAQKIEAPGESGPVGGLSVVTPDRALLIVNNDGGVLEDRPESPPDMIVPPLVFAVLAQQLGVDPWSKGTPRKVTVQ